MPRTAPRRRPGATAMALAAAVALFAWHAWQHFPFFADDALISLVYAERLLAGEGLTWSDGARVEGYSNLLWVLAAAAVGLTGLDLVVAARALGVASVLATFAAVAVLARRAGGPGAAEPPARAGSPRTSTPSAATEVAAGAACALMAASGTIAVWSIGGLEQPLVAALLAGAVVAAARLADGAATGGRAGVPLGLTLGALCLARPDSPLFVAALAAAVTTARRSAWRPALAAALIAAAFVAAQLVFRLAYYGDVLPNPAYVKLALTTQRVRAGLEYLMGGVRESWLVQAAGLVGVLCLLGRRESRALGLVLAYAWIAWASYVVYIGGDIFPAYRHLYVLHVLAALASLGLWRHASVHRGAAATLGLAYATLLAVFTADQLRAPANLMARSERWEWDGAALGELLRTAYGADAPLLAVTAAGCLPYFSKLPAVDMLGLNDRHIARQRPPDFGSGYLGHELGDGEYVLGREPDLVAFCGALGSPVPCYRSGKELAAHPRFAREYALRCFETPPPRVRRASLFVRTASGKLAPQRAADGRSIVLPGHLFAGSEMPVAALDDEGRIGVRLAAGAEGAFSLLDVPAGAWTVAAEGTGGPVEVVLELAQQGAQQGPEKGEEDGVETGEVPPPAASAHGDCVLPAPGTLAVRVRAGSAPAHVTAVHLARR